MSKYLLDKEWMKKFAATLKSVPTEGVTMEVPMALIIRDDEFNARKAHNFSTPKDEVSSTKAMGATTQQGGTTITDLADQIRRDGQLNPLLCRPAPGAPGKLSLVAGFRRHAALEYLKSETAMVLIKDMSEAQARVMNLAENVSRKDLKPYEVAIALQNLRDNFGMKPSVAGNQLGFTPAYVTFLTTILDKGHPRLIRLWAEGKFKGVLTVDNLYKWSRTLNSDEQMKEFEDLRVVKGFDEDGNEKQVPVDENGKPIKSASNGTGPKGPRRPTDNMLKAAIERAESGNLKGIGKDKLAGAVAALRFVLGEVGTLDGWYDPAAEKEALEKAAKLEKAKADAAKAAEKVAELSK